MLRLDGIRLRRAAFTLSVSLEVPAGARVAVIGASGAGKSSLLDVVAGFETPDTGQVWLEGRDVTARPVADRPVSILFQDGNLFPHLSVAQNVGLGLRADLRLSKADDSAVADALGHVGLDGFGDRRPADLSGGQRARVALARMLLRDRPLALLDEPFAALDPGLRAEMAGLLRDLVAGRGMTLVMVVHDLRGLEGLIDRICLMEDGQVVVDGPFDALRAAPPDALRPWL